jgi:formylglycine-generating enzyme required for sulfatase activity
MGTRTIPPGNLSLGVVRGGSWRNRSRDCRAACRSGDTPASRLNIVGFRVAFRLD